jgi:hypothetical protein
MDIRKVFTLGKINLVLLLLVIGATVFMITFPIEPIEVFSVNLKTTALKAGEELRYAVKFCKNIDADIPGDIDRYLVDAKHADRRPIEISGGEANGPKGCRTAESSVLLPLNIPDSSYKVRFVYRYYPSILRPPIVVTIESKELLNIGKADIRGSIQKIAKEIAEIKKALPSDTEDRVTPASTTESPSPPQTYPATPPLTSAKPQAQRKEEEVEPEPPTEHERVHSKLPLIVDYILTKLGR